MSNTAAVSQLKDALKQFIASTDGEGRDSFSPTLPPGANRDTPGSRAALNAASESRGPAPNSGQDQGGRRRHLPENVAQAAATAQRLLGELEDLTGRTDARSPGMEAASASGGTRAGLGYALRQRMMGVG